MSTIAKRVVVVWAEYDAAALTGRHRTVPRKLVTLTTAAMRSEYCCLRVMRCGGERGTWKDGERCTVVGVMGEPRQTAHRADRQDIDSVGRRHRVETGKRRGPVSV